MFFQYKSQLSGKGIVAILGLVVVASCNFREPVQVTEASNATTPQSHNVPNGEIKMKIKVGNTTFSATLEDNPTVAKIKSLLPMTLDMSELNGNEKYFHLPSILPTDEAKPGMIQNGDIMLYGNNSLVIFYKAFKTSYGYTRLGRIDDPSDLAATLGNSDVTVTFE